MTQDVGSDPTVGAADFFLCTLCGDTIACFRCGTDRDSGLVGDHVTLFNFPMVDGHLRRQRQRQLPATKVGGMGGGKVKGKYQGFQ